MGFACCRRLPRAWVVEFWRRSGPQLGKLSGDETRALLRAVAGLRLTPQRWWLAKLLTATKKGMSSYHGGVVAGEGGRLLYLTLCMWQMWVRGVAASALHPCPAAASAPCCCRSSFRNLRQHRAQNLVPTATIPWPSC